MRLPVPAKMALQTARDDQLGPTLVMGLGGVFVEILADVVLRVPPITVAEARRALESLKGAKIFSGARGAPAADIDALADMAARLSWLAHDLSDNIAELDLNPVVVLPTGTKLLEHVSKRTQISGGISEGHSNTQYRQ